MIHFLELEPSDSEIQDPNFLDKLQIKRKKLLKSGLNNVQFQVKIVDYGLSKLLIKNSLADTPCGTI